MRMWWITKTPLRRDLREAAIIAQRHTLKEQERHGRLYNRKVKGSPLTVGDRVLVANRGENRRRKVADKWESSPYVVIAVCPDISVYRIQEINSNKVREVDRNFLLPVNFLPIVESQEQDGEVVAAKNEIGLQGNGVDHDARTATWILSNDGFDGNDHTNCTDLPKVSDCVSEILDSTSFAENMQERDHVEEINYVEGRDVNMTSSAESFDIGGQTS